MAIKKLTADFARTARAEHGAERTVYWDKDLPGFGLMVTPAGHRSWVIQYRVKRTSRRMKINGVLPLSEARKEAKALLGRVARGDDPVTERRMAPLANKNTLKAVADRYFTREGKKLRTGAKRHATLERLVYPDMGLRQIHEIRRSDINRLLDDIEDNRGAAMADQVLAILRRIFSWHAARSDEFRSPIVRGMARITADKLERDRVLTDNELRAVWKAAEAFAPPWGVFIRLLLLTAARRTEVAAMTWGEITGNDWTIPRERYKTGAEVTLPLSGSAKKLLASLPRIEGCEFVFTTGGRRPISGFSVFKLQFDIACGVGNWRLHDLRRTARSLMSRAGVPSDHAERCLGHALAGIRGTYDRHRYLDEMRIAFEKLAALIETIVRQDANVVPMERRHGAP